MAYLNLDSINISCVQAERRKLGAEDWMNCEPYEACEL